MTRTGRSMTDKTSLVNGYLVPDTGLPAGKKAFPFASDGFASYSVANRGILPDDHDVGYSAD